MPLTLVKRPGFKPQPLRPAPEPESMGGLAFTDHELALMLQLTAKESSRLKALFGERLAEYPVITRDLERLERITGLLRLELR